jgi:hypothetical protein
MIKAIREFLKYYSITFVILATLISLNMPLITTLNYWFNIPMFLCIGIVSGVISDEIQKYKL